MKDRKVNENYIFNGLIQPVSHPCAVYLQGALRCQHDSFSSGDMELYSLGSACYHYRSGAFTRLFCYFLDLLQDGQPGLDGEAVATDVVGNAGHSPRLLPRPYPDRSCHSHCRYFPIHIIHYI